MNLSPQTYSRLKSRIRARYKRELKRIQKGLKNFPERKITAWMNDNADEVSEYSEINWLFLSQTSELLFFIEQDPELGKYGFGEDEEFVFERWNNSEFANDFLKRLNKGATLGKASLQTSVNLDSHLVTFGDRHILKKDKKAKDYRIQTSLGEREKNKKIFSLLETTLHIDGIDIRLKTHSLKEMKDFSKRIEDALQLIKKYSPTSWERFSAFTSVIVPIKNEEFVSYSHQDLPGYSMINMYHRDFVDLMDDLLHENGHHHLNYYLNLEHLIEEPVEAIYYSPWRRTLRPLRGVYHAYFTFFWAFKLFADILKNIDLKKQTDFSKEQIDKIRFRAIEEYHMLNYTFLELKWAKKQGLIHKQGFALIEEQDKELRKFRKNISRWEQDLGKFKKEFNVLSKTLAKAKKDYAKN